MYPLIRATLIILISGFHFWIPRSSGEETTISRADEVPCALIESVEGDVRILSEDQSRLIFARRNEQVPCGGSIHVKEGWIQLKHRQGFMMRLGSGTFVEVFDHYRDQNLNHHSTGRDHLIVYRGKAHLNARTGTSELRVATANGRARFLTGSGLVLYDEFEQASQVISLGDQVIFENRYEPSRKIHLKSGEASKLDFINLRVVPSTPRALEMASIKEVLSDLNLDAKERGAALTAVRERLERTLASPLIGPEVKRKPAFSSIERKNNYTYARHPGEENPDAYGAYVRKLVGGLRNGEKFLFPAEYQKKQAEAQVKRTAVYIDRKNEKFVDQERKRIIEELSKIRLH